MKSDSRSERKDEEKERIGEDNMDRCIGLETVSHVNIKRKNRRVPMRFSFEPRLDAVKTCFWTHRNAFYIQNACERECESFLDAPRHAP